MEHKEELWVHEVKQYHAYEVPCEQLGCLGAWHRHLCKSGGMARWWQQQQQRT